MQAVSHRNLLALGMLVEVLIFSFTMVYFSPVEESVRMASRYSGRLSAGIFLYCLYLYTTNYPKPVADNDGLRKMLSLFAVLHLIHWGFLAANVYINQIPLKVPKVIGGTLAYLMIVLAPFRLYKMSRGWQWVFFIYVSFVMIMTYIARIKGDFLGAEPFWFHYFMVSFFVVALLVSGIRIWASNRRPMA
ncbi:MAG: hypothetical protein AAF741_17750 [Bacteroidota bacterium]